MIILLVEIESVAACQFLTMLTVDDDLAGTPLITCVVPRAVDKPQDVMAELDQSRSGRLAVPMN